MWLACWHTSTNGYFLKTFQVICTWEIASMHFKFILTFMSILEKSWATLTAPLGDCLAYFLLSKHVRCVLYKENKHWVTKHIPFFRLNYYWWFGFLSNKNLQNCCSFNIFKLVQEGSTSGTTLLFTVFLCIVTLGCILMFFIRKSDGKCEKGSPNSSVSFYSSLVSLLKSIITPLLDIRMLLIVPLMAYSGLQQAFVWYYWIRCVLSIAFFHYKKLLFICCLHLSMMI